jgi:hypothetical protein
MCDYVITRPGPLRSTTLRRSNRDSNKDSKSPVALEMAIMLLSTSIITSEISSKSDVSLIRAFTGVKHFLLENAE